MRLTESQIKSIILSELKNADGLERLDEFKAIFKALTAVFKSIGSAIATAFSAAMADVDEGGYKAVYSNKTPGKSEKALSPKTDPYDQVYTIGRVLFLAHSNNGIILDGMDIISSKIKSSWATSNILISSV